LIEAVVTLALLAVFLGFIFQKQNQQQKQLDEVNTAEAIKVVSNSLKQYLAENQALYPDDGTYELAADDAEFSKFLPTNFSFGNFKAIIKRDNDKFSGLVLTDQTDAKGRPYTNVSAARIAAMLGSSGGFIKANETLATGTMGLWELDMAGYFADPEKEAPVRIVAAVDMEQDHIVDLESSLDDLKSKALFRVKVDGMPDANKMETDIDMSGNSLVDLAFLKYRENGTVKDGFIINAQSGTISLGKQMTPLAVSSDTDAAENTAVVSGNIPGGPYALDLAGTSVMKDLRIENLGGVELSKIIGNYQLRTVHRDVADGAFVPAPGFKVDGTELVTVQGVGLG
jgi:type II secretory pathway pseudopilin PulG